VPFSEATVTWYTALLPEATVWLAGVAVRIKSADGGGVVAAPVRVLVCGEPAALSVTVSVAESVPAALGAKTTEIVQEPPAASALPQLFVEVNEELLVPATLMLLMFSVALPVFVSVAVCAAVVVPVDIDPKSSLEGVSVAAGAAVLVPVPVNVED